eukprot:GHRQ01032739.1.p2 GENE.GHRQ01032739.1~~GHRQ01032739.1.p2  ORF type:complete len:119 (-),score=6.88 GHRQ01032739.1:92-448(-)
MPVFRAIHPVMVQDAAALPGALPGMCASMPRAGSRQAPTGNDNFDEPMQQCACSAPPPPPLRGLPHLVSWLDHHGLALPLSLLVILARASTHHSATAARNTRGQATCNATAPFLPVYP